VIPAAKIKKYIPGMGRDTCGKDQESIFLGWAVIPAANIQKVFQATVSEVLLTYYPIIAPYFILLYVHTPTKKVS
jgi:hypothetical protein